MAELSRHLIHEAAEKSGTPITARLAVDYNRELLTACIYFLKIQLAFISSLNLNTHVTSSADILSALNIEGIRPIKTAVTVNISPTEQQILDLLTEPTHRDELIRKCNLSTAEMSQLLMQMELKNFIVSEQNIYRTSF